MNCKITEQQTRQIMRLDGDVTPAYQNQVQRTVTLDDAILDLEHSKLGYQL